MNNSKKYQSYINKIQKIRGKNNVNWMDILRLAFKHAPKEASAIIRRINSDDKISISFFDEKKRFSKYITKKVKFINNIKTS